VASVAGPDRQGVAVPLSTTAPGRYEGNFPASQTGNYLVRVAVSEHGQVTHAALGGLSVAYSAEYQFLGTDAGFLQEIARAGGGTVLSAAGSAFKVALPKVQVKESLAFFLLAVAALLLPLDVAARRLVASRSPRETTSRRAGGLVRGPATAGGQGTGGSGADAGAPEGTAGAAEGGPAAASVVACPGGAGRPGG